MTKARRQLIAWAVLGVQTLVLTLGTAQVCAEGQHTHGGVAAPECAMHHHASGPSAAADHAQHGHQGHATETSASGAQIACRCSNKPPATYIGEIALLEAPVVTAPFIDQVRLPGIAAAPVLGHRFSPPSPPPR